MNNLIWLQQWYLSNTNGDWEHTYGLLIKTLDNPGWRVEIDLLDTPFDEIAELSYALYEASEDDWFTLEIKDGLFRANGDPSKLDFIIGKFREIISKATPSYPVANDDFLKVAEPMPGILSPVVLARLMRRRRRARVRKRPTP